MGDPRPVWSDELGFQGHGSKEERDIESWPIGAGSMPCRCRVHILREGHEVALDEDEPRAGSGKHALGEASHSGL